MPTSKRLYHPNRLRQRLLVSLRSFNEPTNKRGLNNDNPKMPTPIRCFDSVIRDDFDGDGLLPNVQAGHIPGTNGSPLPMHGPIRGLKEKANV